VLVSPDDGAIGHATVRIDVSLNSLENGRPTASFRPFVEAVVDALPRTEALRQIAPWRASLRDPKHGIDEVSRAAL
jgi:hypothetical protein